MPQRSNPFRKCVFGIQRVYFDDQMNFRIYIQKDGKI